MLEARQLSVEVGGRLTLEEASLLVRAGDKVGLVGRNGAGKTSLLKVLGGEVPPASGSVRVQGRIGFLSQDPRAVRPAGAGTGLAHILSGRGLDEAATQLEKLRLAMEEHPSERAIARFARAEDAFAAAGGLRGRVRGPPDRGRPGPGRRSDRPSRRRALGRRTPAGRAGSHPVCR